jgi:hypothetical protein
MRRSAAAGIALVMVLAGSAGAALATAPRAGTYHGALAAPRSHILVRFKVSQSAKTVSSLRISDIPLFCSGGGPAVAITFKNATISSAGRFKSTGRQIIQVGPNKGQVGATLSITGRFLTGGHERGTITTVNSASKACGGTTSYTAKRS